MEDKKKIVQLLKELVMETSAGIGIVEMTLHDETTVTVCYENGTKEVDVSGDSGIAIIKDVVNRL